MLFILLVSAGCTPDNSFAPGDLVGAYLTIIDTMYNEDTALNGDQYIVVDTSAMANLDRAAKDKILKAMEKYGCTVLDDGFDGLEAKGYIKDVRFEHGVLFILKDSLPVNGVITIEAEKWNNGAGADNCKFDLEKKGGVWQIVKRYDYSYA
jgi:hypothetical protein